MAPYEADRHKKEKDALNLIIKMKKQDQPSSGGGQIIFFVVMPLLLAFAVMKHRDIQTFAQQNKQVSAVIKMVYPAWKTYDELYPPRPAEQEPDAAEAKTNKHAGTGSGSKSGKPTKGGTKHAAPYHQNAAPAPAAEEPAAPRHFKRGSLLNN